jgi:hypothetical protein
MVLYRTAYTLGIELFFSHSSDKMRRRLMPMTKYFVIFGSFIYCLWSFLPTCSTADDSRQLLGRDESAFDNSGQFLPWDLHKSSVWYKLIDKTYYGAYIFYLMITLCWTFIDSLLKRQFFTVSVHCGRYGSMMFISSTAIKLHYSWDPEENRRLSLLLSIFFGCITHWFNYFVESLLITFLYFIYYHQTLIKNQRQNRSFKNLIGN